MAAMDDDCDNNDNDVDGDQSSLPSADYNGRPRSEFFIHSDDREWDDAAAARYTYVRQ